jgi:hypothetical protein
VHEFKSQRRFRGYSSLSPEDVHGAIADDLANGNEFDSSEPREVDRSPCPARRSGPGSRAVPVGFIPIHEA